MAVGERTLLEATAGVRKDSDHADEIMELRLEAMEGRISAIEGVAKWLGATVGTLIVAAAYTAITGGL